MSQPSKVKKPKGQEMLTPAKAPKTIEVKLDHANKTMEKSQPTAEQMRIAQIIDTKPEDPSLRDKLKQVMDATQKSEDEAYLALHDSDHDLNRAVNLLLEGGTQDEWSTSSKKKKPRSPNDKVKEADPTEQVVPEEDWSNCTFIQRNKTNEARGGARNRPFNKSGAPRTNKAPSSNNTVENSEKTPRRNEAANGPSRGGKSFRGGRQASRGFGRGRGGSMFRRPIETWGDSKENANHQNSSSAMNTAMDDWDSEEYTGSLANSQVFTPSSSTEPNSLPGVESVKLMKEDVLKEINSETGINSLASQIMPHFSVPPPRTVQTSPPLNKSLISDVGTGLGNVVDPAVSSIGRGGSSMVSALCGVSKAEYMYAVGRGRSIGLISYTQSPEDLRLGRLNLNKPKPRIPPPSKIPSSAVEMPPEVDSGIGLLDVQFGALEFGELSEIIPSTRTSSHATTPSPSPADTLLQPNDSILANDARSYSPSPGPVTASLASQLADVSPKLPETTSTVGLYQDNVYQSSLYTKPSQATPNIYNNTYSAGQILTSNNIIYSTSSSSSTYASSSVGSYGNTSYPYQYPSYPISQPTSLQTSSSNSYQSAGSGSGGGPHYGNSQSVYGSSSLGTSPYSSGYQGYNSTAQHNHKSLSSSTSSNKETFNQFESTSTGSLGPISHSSISMSGTTLLSSTQTTSVTKPTSASSMAKGTVVANMPPGVPPLVGTPQYIVGQGGVPYYGQPPMYYEDLQIMPQQRLPHHITAGYYEMGYQPTTTREGVQYNISDGRFARADNTSPVQASSMNQQQSATPAHQQPLMNPTAIPPYAAYFYGGSMIPSNFQFGAPTIYPVAATGSNTGHGSSSTGVYGKGPTNYAGNYSGIYESGQQNVNDYKTSSSQGPKAQPTQSGNPSTSSDISIIYSKSHSALSKSYDKPGFHCPTPPPYNLGSQNSGIGPTGGYPPLYIPAMTPHSHTTMMHQTLHQESNNSGTGRSQVGSQQSKVVAKSNYSSSNYWAPN